MWDHSNIDQLNRLQDEVPALFDDIMGIMMFERSCRYLPPDVGNLVRLLVTKRINLFENAPRRQASDYIRWEDPEKEHPSQFYPNWPVYRYPKEYNVRYDLLKK